MEKINLFWFRRDLRLEDNHGLFRALSAGQKVQALFIFDTDITSELPKDDARITFIYELLENINLKIKGLNASLLVKKGKPIEVFQELINEFNIQAVYTNQDYEPYAINRDLEIEALLRTKEISFHTYKDQVIFEKSEVVKDDGKPYTVYTPFMKKWMKRLTPMDLKSYECESKLRQLVSSNYDFPSIEKLGFSGSQIRVQPFDISKEILSNYTENRDLPAIKGTSQVSPHLRFGSISVRKLARIAKGNNFSYFKELVWREFFMQILYHFPRVVHESFKIKYEKIPWRNDEADFKKWCEGKTGYPMVDAGMRELNKTGIMHNRVRMVVASFLCKHLLIDWRWGESYFATRLLDYELSSNNGNWQWAAGTGCDAAPYFRVFNPISQATKFDKNSIYIRHWIPELDSFDYPSPMVDHKFARERAINTYKQALSDN